MGIKQNIMASSSIYAGNNTLFNQFSRSSIREVKKRDKDHSESDYIKIIMVLLKTLNDVIEAAPG
jgi:hypothetical protein